MAQDETSVSREFLGLSLNQTPSMDYDDEPPPPVISSEGIIPLDITDKFLRAARSLAPGELVKDGYFTLFESVGALEIMDPKMDSGCLAPGESLDEDYDLTRPLSATEVLGIMDQMLCHEMSWHLGYPLSQTLFTNVYVEAILMPPPSTIREAHFVRSRDTRAASDPLLLILRAYLIGMLKACSYVADRIKHEHYYEEEDFVTNTYHRTLLDHIKKEDIDDVIQEARATLHSIRNSLQDDVAQALDFRLELRLAFLRAIELSHLRTSPPSLETPWVQMKAVLESIKDSHHLATPVPASFSAKIQRRLASTMPPRPIVELSFEEAHSNFERLCVDGLDVIKVLDFSDSQSLLNFVLLFQAKKPQPLVYIRTLLQSYLFKDMVILGSHSIRDIIDDDLSTVVLPSSRLLDRANDAIEAPHDPRFAIAHQMEQFRQIAAQSYLDIFRSFCQNRCRIRRTLCHSVRDWDAVQADAEEIDNLLQVQLEERPMVCDTQLGQASNAMYSLPLSSWAYLYKLRLMEWIVQQGFELDIYQPDELAGMYWYLSYLAKTRTHHVERIKAFTLRSFNEQLGEGGEGRQQRRLTPSANHKAQTQFTRSLSYLRVTMLDAAVTWELADALSCLHTALLRLGLVVPPPRPYSTDQLRYEIRMRPFASVGSPELPSFDVFVRAAGQPNTPTPALLAYAERAAAGARKGFEALRKLTDAESFSIGCHDRWTAAVTNGLRSAIAVGLAASTVRKALESTSAPAREGSGGDGTAIARSLGLKVEFKRPEDRYHEWWVVPHITRQA
ncbi:hypothetical protein VTK73DRAFT_1169 [Phialemonium thermophilum]|uniref:Uncharacterized protein n=1 Tax=Phialemonium thermophilum TaxID=223376 RepID=A0ABR3XBK7_9PEZI